MTERSNPADRRSLRVVLTAFILLVAVLAGPAISAFAGGIGGGVGAGGEGGSNNGGGSGTGGGGSDTGGGGGGGQSSFWYFTVRSTAVAPGVAEYGCASERDHGRFLAVDYTWRVPNSMSREEAQRALLTGSPEVVRTGQWCLYEAGYTDTRVTCVLALDAKLEQTVPNARTLAHEKWASAFKGNRTLANCETAPQRINVSAEADQFGRYLFNGRATLQACNKRHYTSKNDVTGELPADKLVDCSAAYQDNVKPGRWQLDCAGFHERWYGNPSWNADDCRSGSGTLANRWTCSTPGANQFNGQDVSGTATQFRDGAFHNARFGVSKPVGPAITVKGTTTTLHRAKSSTPWNSNGRSRPVSDNDVRIQRNGSNVLYNATTGKSLSGTVRDYDVAGSWASNAGAPTVLTNSYKSDVRYTVETVRITGVETMTAKPIIERRTRVVETTATCESNPLSINYVRAITSR